MRPRKLIVPVRYRARACECDNSKGRRSALTYGYFSIVVLLKVGKLMSVVLLTVGVSLDMLMVKGYLGERFRMRSWT